MWFGFRTLDDRKANVVAAKEARIEAARPRYTKTRAGQQDFVIATPCATCIVADKGYICAIQDVVPLEKWAEVREFLMSQPDPLIWAQPSDGVPEEMPEHLIGLPKMPELDVAHITADLGQ